MFAFQNNASVMNNECIQYDGTSAGAYWFTIGPIQNMGDSPDSIAAYMYYGDDCAMSPRGSNPQAIAMNWDPSNVDVNDSHKLSTRLVDAGGTTSWTFNTNSPVGGSHSFFAQGIDADGSNWKLSNEANAFNNDITVSQPEVAMALVRRRDPFPGDDLCQAVALCYPERAAKEDIQTYLEAEFVSDLTKPLIDLPGVKILRERYALQGRGVLALAHGVERVILPPAPIEYSACLQRTGRISRSEFNILRDGSETKECLEVRMNAQEVRQALVRVERPRNAFSIVKILHRRGHEVLGGLTLPVPPRA